jgi:hypothetical protein
MRRITIWAAATIAIIAVVFAYQLSATGHGGNHGDGGPAEATSTTNADHAGKPGENK